MCVTQLSAYLATTSVKSDENQSYQKDLDSRNLKVIDGSYKQWRRQDGTVYVSTYHVINLKKVKALAKMGNPYAIDELKKAKETT